MYRIFGLTVFLIVLFAAYCYAAPKQIVDPDTGIVMVYIQGGCYLMGCVENDGLCEADEKPPHKVCIDDFYIGKSEVTVSQYKKCVKDGGCLSAHSGCWTLQSSDQG